jgi:hypothetical protein
MTLKDMILDYVNDHKTHFDAYPIDVEVDGRVYSWEEYWAVINSDSQK